MPEIKSQHNYTRYLKFIVKLKQKDFGMEKTEKHHVFPKSLFPELALEKVNLIEIGLREHYICHLMLAKIFGGKMWFALNLMQRAMPEENKNSYNYKSSRIYI